MGSGHRRPVALAHEVAQVTAVRARAATSCGGRGCTRRGAARGHRSQDRQDADASRGGPRSRAPHHNTHPCSPKPTSPLRTPMGANPGPQRFSLQNPLLGNRSGGHHRRSWTPELAATRARGEGHAPVLAVLLAVSKKKADESIPDPKGRESWTPRTFPCITAVSGDRGKGPSSPCWTPRQTDAVMVGEAMPPLWQYLFPP